jgi:uncharacterized protein
MKSTVYFIKVGDAESFAARQEKFSRLLDASKILDCIGARERVAIKIHFGEEGNTGFVKPEYCREVAKRIIEKQSLPFLSDSNTLYRGRRMTSYDHTRLAYEHGFTREKVKAEVFIPDEQKTGSTAEVALDGEFVKTAKVMAFFLQADSLVSVAHFKGHLMTGFGGSLKNIGMGCASREGKLFQHSGCSPVIVVKNCTGCGSCVKVCPVQAIVLLREKAVLDGKKCIGCASCIAACKFNAVDIDWEAGGSNIQEKMTEYALAVLREKRKKSVFFNFAVKITRECDCLAKDDPKISPDIGILVSADPVSVDKASLDLVTKATGKDIFKEEHPQRDGFKQLAHAAKIGLGNLEYELREVS